MTGLGQIRGNTSSVSHHLLVGKPRALRRHGPAEPQLEPRIQAADGSSESCTVNSSWGAGVCQGEEIRDPGSEDRAGGGQAGRESQCRERCWWLDSVHKGEDGAERGAKEVGPY